MIKRLVVNGCSYMDAYAVGKGHVDLAARLNIPTAESLAKSGSANSRSIRTCLRDCYNTSMPTLYIIGVTFFSRTEITVVTPPDPVEGTWKSLQNQLPSEYNYNSTWSEQDMKTYIDLKSKYMSIGFEDQFEFFAYQLLSLVDTVQGQGHQILIFNQVEQLHLEYGSSNTFDILAKRINIVDQLKWAAVPWQFENGTTPMDRNSHMPLNIRHPNYGDHHNLNRFLVDYIKDHKLL